MAVPALCVTHLELSSCLMAAVRVSSPSLSLLLLSLLHRRTTKPVLASAASAFFFLFCLLCFFFIIIFSLLLLRLQCSQFAPQAFCRFGDGCCCCCCWRCSCTCAPICRRESFDLIAASLSSLTVCLIDSLSLSLSPSLSINLPIYLLVFMCALSAFLSFPILSLVG